MAESSATAAVDGGRVRKLSNYKILIKYCENSVINSIEIVALITKFLVIIHFNAHSHVPAPALLVRNVEKVEPHPQLDPKRPAERNLLALLTRSRYGAEATLHPEEIMFFLL